MAGVAVTDGARAATQAGCGRGARIGGLALV